MVKDALSQADARREVVGCGCSRLCGSLGSGRSAGYAIGEDRNSPSGAYALRGAQLRGVMVIS